MSIKNLWLLLSCILLAACSSSGDNSPTDTLMRVVAASVTACPNGGVTISTGIDTNDNGVLDDSEVTSTQTSCYGGMPTHDSLVNTTMLSPGDSHCPNGGTQIDTGLDNGAGGGTADDGILQPGEITSTQYVCNGGGGLPSLAGFWQFVSGSIPSNAGNIGTPRILSLDDTGAGELYTLSATQNVKGDLPLLYSVVDSHVAEIEFSIGGGNGSGGGLHSYNYELPDPNTLELTDVGGTTTKFQRTSSIGDAAPVAITTAQIFSLPMTAVPDGNSGIASDGTGIWYTVDSPNQGAVRFDPATSTTSDEVVLSGEEPFFEMSAVEGGDFWLSAGGNGSQLERWTQAGVLVDQFDLSASPINDNGQIYAATSDGTELVLSVYDYADERLEVMTMNTNNPPDTIASKFAMSSGLNLTGLALSDGHLWALIQTSAGFVIADLDPNTGDALETYTLPAGLGANANYKQDLTVLNGAFYSWYYPNNGGRQLVQLSGGF